MDAQACYGWMVVIWKYFRDPSTREKRFVVLCERQKSFFGIIISLWIFHILEEISELSQKHPTDITSNVMSKDVLCRNFVCVRNYENPILSFYVLKEQNYSPELRAQYEKEFLPEHLRMYKELTKDHEAKKIDDKIMLVTLKDGKFNLYETTLRTYYKD